MLLLHVKNLMKNDNNNNKNNNNNNNNDNNNSNKKCNSNKSVTLPPLSKSSKETVFILGDIMVKKLNCFLLTRKLNYKCLVKVRPFSSAKFRCMHDHVKPSVQDFNLNHTILHCKTNDLSSERTASQIARSIIELALTLKSHDNKISISLFVPRNDNLNNKANGVNSCLIYMGAEQ